MSYYSLAPLFRAALVAPQASARTTTSAHGYRAAPGCVFSLAHPFIAPLTWSDPGLLIWSDTMVTIHDAAFNGDIETLRRLLSEGVSPDATENGNPYRGRTPLHNLCFLHEHYDATGDDITACFRLLCDAGASLEAVDYNGYTLLHYAANVANTKMVSLLLEASLDVNAVSDFGWTALHFAASGSSKAKARTNCVKMLLAARADIDVRSDSGRTPFDMALDQNLRRVWPLLLRAGAEIPTNNTHPYAERVRNAGGFQRYAQAHVARIAAILETPLLPQELVRKVLEFHLHAGYY